MPILILVLILALLSAFFALMTWILSKLFGRDLKLRTVVKRTVLVFCICVPLVLFFLLPILFSEMISRAASRPQDRILQRIPAELSSSYREVSFFSRDHLKIRGWYLPASNQPVIIFAHGLFRSRNETLERGCRLNQMGYPVLLFDFRSHGTSERSPITLGVQERLDILGACDFLINEFNHGELVLSGISMGAVASLLASPEAGGAVKAVVADSPYDDLRSSIGKHVRHFLHLPGFPFTDVFLWNLERRGQFNSDRFQPVSVLRSIRQVPMLFIYGAEDRRMDSSVAENLYRASSSSRRELHFFKGANHGAAFKTDPERYLLLIHNFIQSID